MSVDKLGNNNFKANINGIEVKAVFTEDNIQEIFIPWLKRLNSIYEEKGHRVLCYLAAPPGAGKSTLLRFLEHLSNTSDELRPITAIGMDGFHRYQDYLLSHTIIRDGKDICMVDVKGCPETFDLSALADRIRMISQGHECSWPEYNRQTHNPIENAITVKGDIVVLEGNYLLLDSPGWDNLRQYADYTVRIVADPDMLRTRLLDRKMKSASASPDSANFVDFSDMYNVRLCLEHSLDADLCIKLNEDNSYSIL